MHVIFDFDGTLADTFNLGASLLNSYAEKFGYNKIDFANSRHLSAKELNKVIVPLPSLEEQKQIANYFSNLDKQISIQEQRLEKLKQIKSACLKNMFV